ncbi:MAG: bifunctional demethylmenaquinone methyltransferase/2-methoxy-6-polyprenyl-1,4-benzoquinol methylase UbiE [Bacteroidales bacterium]|nr:bifunctional demethylmenaquinone methyltransferase/2-methoxy-6-polyprenyl-1,4-benzoquinol methylase UbiE [Bacteroidales bacterium]
MIESYINTNNTKKEQVSQMFDNIAWRYDFLNHLLSFGIDKIWRKKAVKLLKEYKPKIILDIAAGTGDFAIEASKLKPDKIIGIDISREMLNKFENKIKKKKLSGTIEVQIGDAENIKFNNNYFDAIIVGFGVRNFENLTQGINEMYRVLKNGGNLIILEFSKPNNSFIRKIYNLYFLKILPFVGKLFSKDSFAYSYLPESVKSFPEYEELLQILKNTGFSNSKFIPLSFGIATLYIGQKK